MEKSGYRFLLVCLMMMCAVLAACKPELVTKPEAVFQATHAWMAENKAAITYGLPGQESDMEQAFRQGYILVYAEGLPKQGVEHTAQKRLMAQRAAEVVAQRNLARLLSRDGRYGSVRFDSYSSALQPALQGFQVVSREYNNELGKAVVLLKYDLRGATR